MCTGDSSGLPHPPSGARTIPQTRLPANLDDANPTVQLQACCFVDELDPWVRAYEASEG